MEFGSRMEFLKIAPIIFLFLTNGLQAKDSILRLPFFKANQHCSIEKKIIYLTKKQIKKIQIKFHSDFNEQIVRRYKLECNNKSSNVFVLDDQVRSKLQTLLIEVKNSRISHAETLEFKEHTRFKTPKQWFHQTAIGQNLKSVRSIDGISGATLTSRSNKELLAIALYLSQEII